MELDANAIEQIAKVLNALKLGNGIKIRSVTFDITETYSYRSTHRVRLTGARSKYDNTINVTKIDAV